MGDEFRGPRASWLPVRKPLHPRALGHELLPLFDRGWFG